MRHRPSRRWWTPWRRSCICGLPRWPCPDATPFTRPPVAESLRLNQRHGWDGPTVGLPHLPNHGSPLLTPGQAYRTRHHQRRWV